MIDLTFRCFSRARWIAVATARGIYTGSVDENGKEVVASGFVVDEIGSIVLTPAVLDANGNVVTPAVMDTWYWINLRITGQASNDDDDTIYPGETEDGFKFTKSKLAKFVRNQATPVNLTYAGKTIRTYQFGAAANRIQLIDPRDYKDVRVREWLGGPQY